MGKKHFVNGNDDASNSLLFAFFFNFRREKNRFVVLESKKKVRRLFHARQQNAKTLEINERLHIRFSSNAFFLWK